jgi:hypothetical protein
MTRPNLSAGRILLAFALPCCPAAWAQGAPQTITFTSFPAEAHAYMTFSFQASASSGLPLAFQASGVCALLNAPPPVPPNTVFIGGATGTCTITATQAGNEVYAPATASATVTVGRRKLQAVLNGAPAAARYGDVLGISSSTSFSTYVPVVFVSGACTSSAPASSVTVTMTDSSGTCNVTAWHPGDAVVEVLPASAAISATKRPVTIKTLPHYKLPGQPDPPWLYGITSGYLAFGDVLSGAPTREPGEEAGNYAIMQGTVSAPAHYLIAWQSAPLHIVDRSSFRLQGSGTYWTNPGTFRNNPALSGLVSFDVDVGLGASGSPTGTVSLATAGEAITFQATALHSFEPAGIVVRVLGFGNDHEGLAYGFMLAVWIESGWQRLRLIVWDGSGIVYDTEPGQSPSALPNTLRRTGGFSITP